MSNRRRAQSAPTASPRVIGLAGALVKDHKPSSDVCISVICNGTREIYKTARKPWRHLDTHSTYCEDDKRGRKP